VPAPAWSVSDGSAAQVLDHWMIASASGVLPERRVMHLRAWVITMASVAAIAAFAMAAGSGSFARATAAPHSVRAASNVAARVTIRETEFHLSPSRPRARRSGLIQLTARNSGTIVHALAIRTARGTVRTRNIRPDSSAVLRVRLRRGRYRFFCPIDGHRQLGMRGTLTVG
jgi:plastocyanin